MNFFDHDPALRRILDRLLSYQDSELAEPVLRDMGEIAAGELDQLAVTAEAHPPELRQYGPDGDRVDEVEYHPAYHEMVRLAFSRFGLAAMSHRSGVLGWPGRVPHVVKYALSYLFVQSEFGLACPLSMTDSAARILRLFDPERFAGEIDRLTSFDPDTLATGAMFMTEIQGGTDVGRTATVATEHESHWTLSGHKWFASNVSAEFILTLARVPGQGEGTRGLGMFLVPKLRPDGSRNNYRIDRLKDKLGSRSMASGEVTLDEAYAVPVGELRNGFRQMAEMVNVSRLSNAMRATALMRRAVRESVEHTRQRVVFDKPLFEQPLMRTTLLPMILDTEASLGFVLEAAARLDDADAGEDDTKQLVRVLTPLAKYTICKQARSVTGEAMEIRGGDGYIEDRIHPRLVRDAHLGSIWEGSSNVIALDVLRCMRREGAHQHVADTYGKRLTAIADPAVRPAVDAMLQRWQTVREDGDRLLGESVDGQESGIGCYADTLARTVMASLLLEQAAHDAGGEDGYRTLLVAHSYLRRLRGTQPSALRTASTCLEALADGGHVPYETAAAALESDTPREIHHD